MSKYFFWLIVIICIVEIVPRNLNAQEKEEPYYLQNRSPLIEKPYLSLPLGSIKPQKWLLDQLLRMKEGMTGHLDTIYPEVMGPRNGWLGGDGDGWERGPYWIDGLLPLAYILNDSILKAKVEPWVEWTLTHQTNEGYIGPIPFKEDPTYEPGLQKGMRRDWWPKMVMLKVLQQYYEATGDDRVVKVLTNYFKYQLNNLPDTPLDHWTFWGNRRGGDNLQVVYWLYNITGDDFLLDLGNIITEQTFPWAKIFLQEETPTRFLTPWHFSTMKRYPFDEAEITALTVSKKGGMHTVNFAHSLKQPIISYQYNKDEKNIFAVKKALSDIKQYHGQPQGMYGGDEPLHGNNPLRGVEFCSISEEMFSLESMLQITGDMEFANLLEKITYNALPTQASDDFMSRQYFQSANQIELTDKLQTTYESKNHKGTDQVFGQLTGYPCCTSNMHQSWPKYVQNLWYATHDGGVAALLYAPSEVSLKVGKNANLRVIEETGFPFRESVKFTIELDKKTIFPFHLRIPNWANEASITINGEVWKGEAKNQVVIINREWKNGDQIILELPMKLRTSVWYEFSKTIERGPLVYALKIRAKQITKNRHDGYGEFQEIYPIDDWNFGLRQGDLENLSNSVKVSINKWNGEYPWNLENAPIELKMTGVKIPEWTLNNGAPVFPAFWGGSGNNTMQSQEITLIPYGCTTLRITEFPVYNIR